MKDRSRHPTHAPFWPLCSFSKFVKKYAHLCSLFDKYAPLYSCLTSCTSKFCICLYKFKVMQIDVSEGQFSSFLDHFQPIQLVKFQTFLQPWWKYYYLSFMSFLDNFQPIQLVKFQKFFNQGENIIQHLCNFWIIFSQFR